MQDDNIEVSWDAASGEARISGELTIYQIEAVRGRLLDMVDAARRIELDLGGVSDIDSAGFQLLVALVTECSLRGVPLTLTRSSGVLDELTDLYRYQFGTGSAFGVAIHA